MLQIYSTPESLYCAKLRIALTHKRARWEELTPEGGCGSAVYRERIPAGTMPALVDGEFVLADSEAIAEYLEETVPTPPMLPESPQARARCRERSRFHDTRLEPEVRALFPYIGQGMQGSEIGRLQSEKLCERLSELGRLLVTDAERDAEFLSLGDCGFPISFAWLDMFTPVMGLTLIWPDPVLDYRRELNEHSAVASVLADYRPHMNAWLESKMQ